MWAFMSLIGAGILANLFHLNLEIPWCSLHMTACFLIILPR